MRFDHLERPPLDSASLSAALTRGRSLGGDPLWHTIEVLETSPSTNAELSARARAGAAAGLVVVAEHQTSGRGRLDRLWETPARAALTFSFLLSPDRVPIARWPWLPLLTGIAVAEGIRRTAGIPAALKWPNDVLVAERKVAGILVERVERDSGAVAVIGVGLNVTTRAEELPVPTATSLSLQGARTVDRSVLLRGILRSFEALYTQWQDECGDASNGLLDSYRRRCVTVGQRIRVELPGRDQVFGQAVGIDVDGRLQVSTSEGTLLLGAGDVVHIRPAEGSPA